MFKHVKKIFICLSGVLAFGSNVQASRKNLAANNLSVVHNLSIDSDGIGVTIADDDNSRVIYLEELVFIRGKYGLDDLLEEGYTKISVSDEDYSDIIDTCDSIWECKRKPDEDFERFRAGEITIDDMDDAPERELDILESKLFGILSKYHN